MFKNRFSLFVTSIILFLPAMLNAGSGTQVIQLQRSYPVLIGRKTNNIVELKVTVPKKGIEIRSLRFDLKGTTDIQDIASLTLFVSGPEGQLETKLPIATVNTPAERLDVQCNIPLNCLLYTSPSPRD